MVYLDVAALKSCDNKWKMYSAGMMNGLPYLKWIVLIIYICLSN